MNQTIVRSMCCLGAVLLAGCGSDSEDPQGSGGAAGASGGSAGAGGTLTDAASYDAHSPPGDSSDDRSTNDAGQDQSTPPTDGGGDRSHCKRGVAYGHHSAADMTVLAPAVSWWYNWAHKPDDGVVATTYVDLGVEYVPMVWGGSFDPSTVATEIPQGAKTLLGFNEPNFYSQANLSSQEAGGLWPGVQQIATQRGLKIVSPAVNYCGGGCHDTDPVNYLNDFFAACGGCTVDAIAVHIYVGCNAGGAHPAQWLIDKVEMYKAAFSQPIWVTEFACDSAASMQDQQTFLEDAVTWLEQEPRVQRYAWFSGRADNMNNVDLLGEDGSLTVLGQSYVSLPQAEGCTR